jgi:muramoyltetrapeptide carboxypeptidase
MFLKPLLFAIILVCFSCGQHTEAQTNSEPETEIENSPKMMTPPYLKAGDTVAIVAPSGILNNREKEVNQAIELLESWELNVAVGANVFSKDNHFAGTDKERALDFQNALNDPKIKAIWCARGGYGTVRMIDLIDYSKLREQPKWLIGYSDITAIHNDFNNLAVESIHGLMCTSLTDDLTEIETSIESFKNAIFGKSLNYTIEGSSYNKIGEVSGELVGGNLTLLHTMLGSRSSINTDGKILFIEEIGEYKYHIDRMLQSLERAGYFENLKGVIVGNISKLRKNTTPWGKPIEQLILDVFAEYDFPILFNFPAGHEKENRAIILGRALLLSVGKEKSTIIFDN